MLFEKAAGKILMGRKDNAQNITFWRIPRPGQRMTAKAECNKKGAYAQKFKKQLPGDGNKLLELKTKTL